MGTGVEWVIAYGAGTGRQATTLYVEGRLKPSSGRFRYLEMRIEPPVTPPNPIKVPNLPGPIQFKTSLSLTEEFAGQYFYLKLATDASNTKYGFKVSAEYRDLTAPN